MWEPLQRRSRGSGPVPGKAWGRAECGKPGRDGICVTSVQTLAVAADSLGSIEVF